MATTLMRVCSEDECNRSEQLRRDMCQMHYVRWKTSGGSGRVCGQADCGGPHYAKDLCAKHYIRLNANGDPRVVGVRGAGRKLAGEQHYKWTGDDASYGAVHYRLRKQRGLASGQTCAHCGASASQWAYDHTDPDERTGVDHGHVLRYSVETSRYMPLCAKCHKALDLAHRRER